MSKLDEKPHHGRLFPSLRGTNKQDDLEGTPVSGAQTSKMTLRGHNALGAQKTLRNHASLTDD